MRPTMTNRQKWQRMNWRDPFLLEDQLAEDQKMVRDSAKQYAENCLAPRVKEAFRNENIDETPNVFGIYKISYHLSHKNLTGS